MNFFIDLNNFLNYLLIFLGLRREQKYWGVVYDSKNKQPLDPVMLKLVDVKTGKVMANSVTDLKGRYGFLADRGKYKIFVSKTHYSFPSKISLGTEDGIYSNLYHGEFLDLRDDSDVISFNIPMDPEGFDWNQEAKQKIAKQHPILENFFSKIFALIFWGFFIFSLFIIYTNPQIWTKVALVVYAVFFLFMLFTPKINLYGRLVSKENQEPLFDSYLELSPIEIPSVVLSHTHTTSDGKFFLRGNSGKYLIRLKKTDALGKEKIVKTWSVTLGKKGFYNKILEV